MNLKLSDTSSEAFTNITFDPNVLVAVELAPESDRPLLFLLVEPDNQTVLEFMFEFGSGFLREFILNGLPRRRVKMSSVDAEGPSVPTKGRRPAFSLEAWPSDLVREDWERRFVRVKDEIELVIGPASASIRFPARKSPTSWVVNARVRFGIEDGGQLARIDLFNLKADEVALLKEAISHKPQ
ncbi:MAG: hypothetical protein M0D55_06785 [Elusimicrobiota bacterium]|nr:MAG: hypothetical protein M0D55_06785 [Elusimicrobiota bacterium]